MNFREFIEKDFTEKQKWKASKDDVINYWRNLQPTTPIQMTPIPYEHKGGTYSQDGIRINGTKEFIGSVLARLKEILVYESPKSKLQIMYRQTDNLENKNSFVFYVQAKMRGQRRKKRSF